MALIIQHEGHVRGLAGWAAQHGEGGSRRRSTAEGDGPPTLRFAFYGRMSTADYQERCTSQGWQREVAEAVIAGHGTIVEEFFDVGCSRRLPWSRRPQAAALLAAAEAGECRFGAVVVGEYERAFATGEQFTLVTVGLGRHGIQVWLPEAGGRVDLASPAHQALVMVLGAQSQREVLRSRHRVLAAMQAQAREQGRFLGGRPPYGYRLVDAGPHPNRAHAQWGRRLQRLDPDPLTAPHVRWMFAERLAGRSVASIARELTERGVPCPSDVDRERNRHRNGGPWTLRTVAVILGNPRYTGREVWNRQRGEHVDGRVAHRSSPVGDWVISAAPAHPALVSEAEFVAAQQVRAPRATKDGTAHRYLLSGLVGCGVCGRRLDSHWVHGRAGYRCRHGYASARPRQLNEVKNIYVREDALLEELAARLSPAEDRSEPAPDAAARLVSGLRASGTMIIHDGSGWILEPSCRPAVG